MIKAPGSPGAFFVPILPRVKKVLVTSGASGLLFHLNVLGAFAFILADDRE